MIGETVTSGGNLAFRLSVTGRSRPRLCKNVFENARCSANRANLALSRELQPGQLGKLLQISRSSVNLQIDRAFLHSLGQNRLSNGYKIRDDSAAGIETALSRDITVYLGALTLLGCRRKRIPRCSLQSMFPLSSTLLYQL